VLILSPLANSSSTVTIDSQFVIPIISARFRTMSTILVFLVQLLNISIMLAHLLQDTVINIFIPTALPYPQRSISLLALATSLVLTTLSFN
jgi:hypothetical protein